MVVLICTIPLLMSFFAPNSSARATLPSTVSTVYCFGNLFFLGLAQRTVGKVRTWTADLRCKADNVFLEITIASSTLLLTPITRHLAHPHIPTTTSGLPCTLTLVRPPPTPTRPHNAPPIGVDGISPVLRVRLVSIMGLKAGSRCDVGTRRDCGLGVWSADPARHSLLIIILNRV